MEYLKDCPNPYCTGKGKEQPPLGWQRKNCAFCSNQMTVIAGNNANRRIGGGCMKPSEQSALGMKLLFRNTPKGNK